MALLRKIEDEVTCPIHLEPYVEPMLLKCLHVLCRSDVDRLTRWNQLECPQCKTFTTKHDIRSDFRTQRLLDLFHADNEKLKREPKCEGCEDDTASAWCYNCNVHLCQRCEKTHRKLPALATHRMEDMTRVKEIKAERKAQIQDVIRINQDIAKWLNTQKAKKGVDTALCLEVKNIRHSYDKLQNDLQIMCDDMVAELESVADDVKQNINKATTIKEKCDQIIQILQGVLQENSTKGLLDKQTNTKLIASRMQLGKVRSDTHTDEWDRVVAKNSKIIDELHRVVTSSSKELQSRKRRISEEACTIGEGPKKKALRIDVTSEQQTSTSVEPTPCFGPASANKKHKGGIRSLLNQKRTLLHQLKELDR